MSMLRLVAALTVGVVGAAPAQLAISQPTERLLVLPLGVRTAADSAASVAVMDGAREKLAALARYKVLVIPKAKLCEALQASGFPCDGLLEESQARLLARFLNADAFTTGTLMREGTALKADVRVVDIGGAGFAFAFTATNGNPGTPAALAEAVAARLNTIVRAGEYARECQNHRQRGAFARALESARKAFAIEPNLTAAHLCVATVYEVQRMPPDSLIAAATRALRGDSLNATAWETIARNYQVKGDTLKAIEAFIAQLRGEPVNTRLRLGVAQTLLQQRQYQRAVDLLDDGLARNAGDQVMIDLRTRICIDGELWRCALDGLTRRAEADTSLLADTAFLKTVLGAAQQLSDTQALLRYGHAAARAHPNSAAFWKALGSAFELAGRPDSAIWAYRRSLTIDPSDLAGGLLVAKAMIEGAVYDTAQVNRWKADTARVRALRQAYADRMDTAKVYITRALAASDTGLRINTAVIMLTAGSKLAQAQAYEHAYPWLDQTLQTVAPRAPADTTGPRHQIRVQASFWFGLTSVQTLGGPYKAMLDSKHCGEAKAINDRIVRTKGALTLGARVHPPTANTLLLNLGRYEELMPRVKQAYKCTNF